jgi:hypothetical protein
MRTALNADLVQPFSEGQGLLHSEGLGQVAAAATATAASWGILQLPLLLLLL